MKNNKSKGIVIAIIIFLMFFRGIFFISPFFAIIGIAFLIVAVLCGRSYKNRQNGTGGYAQTPINAQFTVKNDAEPKPDPRFIEQAVDLNNTYSPTAPAGNKENCEQQRPEEPEFCHNEHYSNAKRLSAEEIDKERRELKSLLDQGFIEADEYNEKMRELR